MQPEALTPVTEHQAAELHIRVAWLCGVVLFLEGYDIAAVGYAIPSLTDAWQVRPPVFTPALTAGNVGLLIGSLGAGLLGDRLGRKPVLIGCVVVFGVFSLLSSLVGSPSQLAGLRFLTGLGLGGGVPLAIALASDFAPPMAHGRLVILMSASVPIGFAVGGLLASQLVRVLGWPAIFVVGGVLPLAIVPLLTLLLPESVALHSATRRRNLVRALFQNGLAPRTGAALGDQSARSTGYLLHPAVDAGHPAQHRRQPVSGDLRHDDVRFRRNCDSLARGAHRRPRRNRACADLRTCLRCSVRAFDRVVRSAILVALGHHVRRRDWQRLPERDQLAVGPDLSVSHPLDRRGLGTGRRACRHHRRADPGRRAAGARRSGLQHIRCGRHPRIRRDATDGDTRASTAQSVRLPATASTASRNKRVSPPVRPAKDWAGGRMAAALRRPSPG